LKKREMAGIYKNERGEERKRIIRDCWDKEGEELRRREELTDGRAIKKGDKRRGGLEKTFEEEGK
jgi:hypothetical protein